MDISQFILYEDEAMLAVNKPAGLRTIPDGYDPNLPYLSKLLSEAFGRVWAVHRLDKDTSGVILFARNVEAHKALSKQFELRETRKEYHAITVGVPEWITMDIALPLRINGDRKHRSVIDHQYGKAAVTQVAVLAPLGVFAQLACSPHTGYTHQIRAHLAAVGFPILQDPLYGSLLPETQVSLEAQKLATDLPIQRTALHAHRLVFKHPVSGAEMTLQAPYPADFNDTLDRLREQFVQLD